MRDLTDLLCDGIDTTNESDILTRVKLIWESSLVAMGAGCKPADFGLRGFESLLSHLGDLHGGNMRS